MDPESIRRHPALRVPAAVLRWLQRTPGLLTITSLAGAAVWLAVSLRDAFLLGHPVNIAHHVEFATGSSGRAEEMYLFFREHWILAAKLMAPALVLALIRLRGANLLLTVSLVSGALFVYWLGSDLHRNLDSVLNDPLGMEPLPEAYIVKLVLTGALMLSPPVLMLLYYRSSIMDRYVVRCFAVPFLLCLGGITAILVTMDLLNDANDYAEAGLSAAQIGMLYLTQLPMFLVTITEAALLLAILYSLGRMSRYNEIITMHSAGRGLLRLLVPVLVIGLWSSLALVALNYQLAPEAVQKKAEMLKSPDNKPGSSADKGVEFNVPYRNNTDHRTWLIYKMPYDLAEGNKMEGVWLFQQTPEGEPVSLLVAKSAMWFPHHRNWTFYEAVVFDRFDPASFVPFRKRAEERLAIEESWTETPGSILSDRLDPEYLGVPRLLSYLRTNRNLPERSLARYESTLHWRIALPFRAFLLVLIAGPLGIVSSRRGLLGGVATAVGLFICVHFLSTLFLKAGEGLYLPPAAGAWAVNVLFLPAALWLIWRRSGWSIRGVLQTLRRHPRAMPA